MGFEYTDNAKSFEIRSADGMKKITGFVDFNSPEFLEIHFVGYGECEALPGYGTPVVISVDANGHPQVHCWNDINSSEPRVISMEGAQESLRRSEEDTGDLLESETRPDRFEET